MPAARCRASSRTFGRWPPSSTTARPTSTTVIEPLAENYLRLAALGAYGVVLQHLLLLDPDQDQRTGRQRHPHSVRWAARSQQGQVFLCQIAQPDRSRRPAAHRHLRHLSRRLSGPGVLRLHQAAVLAPGQRLRRLLHRRRAASRRATTSSLGHTTSARCLGRPRRARRQGRLHRRPRRSASATNRWPRSRPTRCSAQKSLAVTPAGRRHSTVNSVGPHHDSIYTEHRAAGSRSERQ